MLQKGQNSKAAGFKLQHSWPRCEPFELLSCAGPSEKPNPTLLLTSRLEPSRVRVSSSSNERRAVGALGLAVPSAVVHSFGLVSVNVSRISVLGLSALRRMICSASRHGPC